MKIILLGLSTHNAVGLAAGYYLGKGRPAVVYMQNSGIGNAVNPLLSLADSEVYGIPMLLLIGWRGETGAIDEPQHVKQGRITEELLSAMEIPYLVLEKSTNQFETILDQLIALMEERKNPVALLVKKNVFKKSDTKITLASNYEMTRESAVKIIANSATEDAVIISTTGMTSRELYEYRVSEGNQNPIVGMLSDSVSKMPVES